MRGKILAPIDWHSGCRGDYGLPGNLKIQAQIDGPAAEVDCEGRLIHRPDIALTIGRTSPANPLVVSDAAEGKRDWPNLLWRKDVVQARR